MGSPSGQAPPVLARAGAAFLVACIVSGAAACHRPRTPTPQAAIARYAQALRDDDPKAAYALLTRDARRSTPYADFATRWREQAAERQAQLEAIHRDLALLSSPLVFERTATLTAEPHPVAAHGTNLTASSPPLPSGGQAQFVKHGGYWYADTALLSAQFYETPEAAIRALLRALDAPELQALIGVWTDDRRLELSQQAAITAQGLRHALDTGTQATYLDEGRAQFSYYAGDVWFLIALIRERGGWHIESIYSDTGVYPAL